MDPRKQCNSVCAFKLIEIFPLDTPFWGNYMEISITDAVTPSLGLLSQLVKPYGLFCYSFVSKYHTPWFIPCCSWRNKISY